MRGPTDLSGRRFGRLSAIEKTDQRLRDSVVWRCRCDCGAEKLVSQRLLAGGHTRSCGCLKPKSGPAARFYHDGSRKWTHRTAPREYCTWRSMKARCFDPKHRSYARYGGRGITVCDRWRDSFDAFVEDVGFRPNGTSLDRIDNDRGYEPGNTRWSTAEAQGRNTGGTKLNAVAVCLARHMRRRGARFSDMAWAFGVTLQGIRAAVNARTWDGALEEICE